MAVTLSPAAAPDTNFSVTGVLNLVRAGATEGYFVVVCFNQGAIVQPFHVSKQADAEACLLELGRHYQTYVESALQVHAPAPGRRGNTAGVAAVSIVTLDFDGSWGVHKQQNLPDRPEDLGRLLLASEVEEPTVVLQTGGGLLAIWALEELLPAISQLDRDRALRLVKGWQGHINLTARREFGWRLDATHDLVRLIRVPGTLNHKFSPPRAVEALEC